MSPVLHYALWTLAGFAGAVVVNSFVEWAAHRFILHSRRIVSFAWEVHDQQHHVLFRADASYTATADTPEDAERREHVTFVARDYILFLLVTTPVWVAVELLTGRPVAAGGVAATLAGLQMFNSFHWRFHCPTDTWFQRTRFFRFLKEHHRLHHADPRCNLNVHFLPLADLCLRTLRLAMPSGPREGPPQKPVRSSGYPVAPCLLCGRAVDDFCPDCGRPLCLRAECDRGHAASCAPVRRAVIVREAEWR